MGESDPIGGHLDHPDPGRPTQHRWGGGGGGGGGQGPLNPNIPTVGTIQFNDDAHPQCPLHPS